MGLLSRILETQSVSGDYGKMHLLIKAEIAKLKGVTLTEDKYGNMFAVKGELEEGEFYPAFACHTDTVHDIREGYKVLRTNAHIWMAYYEKNGQAFHTGIGGDDKCGIYACLILLNRLPKVKCAFYVDEEAGCLGSERSDIGWYNDCRWVIQVDRKGCTDIITSGMGIDMCSEEFTKAAELVGFKFGYKQCVGVYTDVTFLKGNQGLPISAINISAGYYNAHSPQEYIVEKDLMKAINFCEAMAKNVKHKSVHVSDYYLSKKIVGMRLCSSTGCDNPAERDYLRCEECTSLLAYDETERCLWCNVKLVSLKEKANISCNNCSDSPPPRRSVATVHQYHFY